MTTLAAHQPQYLPWLGFFDKVAPADVFVLLDNVQFKKNEWQNRNRIKGAAGPQWITVPVQHRFPQTIAAVEVRDTEPWRRKHLRALDSNYRRAAHFEEVMAPIAAILEQPQTQLAPLNIELVRRLMQQLGIETRMVLGSEVEAREDSTLRLIDLCLQLGADTYLSGAGADYLDQSAFAEAGISLRFQTYRHPTYPQLYGDFEPYMSVVDLLMNCGPDSFPIIASGRLTAS